MATIRLVPSTIYNAASSYLTITDESNAYTNTDSTTYATVTNTNASTSNRYIYVRGFNFTSVPSGATINSFTVKLKGYYTSGYTASMYLCNGTTTQSGATASSLSSSSATRTFSNGSLTWSTISGWGSDFGIRVNCRRNNRNTQAKYYIYGAEILVDYTESTPVSVTGVSLDKHSESIEEGETVTLTATVSPSDATDKSVSWSTSNSSVATVSNGVVTGVSAGSATITVTTTDGSKTDTCSITVTAPVLTQYKLATTMEAGKSYLIANGNSGSVYLLSNEANGSRTLKGVAATVTNDIISISGATAAKTLFTCTLATQGNDITTGLYIGSQCLYCNNASGLRMNTVASLDRYWHYVDNKFWQFKNSSSNGYDDASSEYKYYLTWSNGNATDSHVDTTSIADSNIPLTYLYTEYTPSTEAAYIKVNGSWVTATKVYKKISGSWVEQNDLSNVFSSGTNYIKG